MITVTFTCSLCGTSDFEEDPDEIGMLPGWRFDAEMGDLLCPNCADEAATKEEEDD